MNIVYNQKKIRELPTNKNKNEQMNCSLTGRYNAFNFEINHHIFLLLSKITL